MAEQVELEITPREVMGKASKKLRRVGIIPANISGHGETAQAIQVDAIAFERIRRTGKATSILTLKSPNAGSQTALIRHVQHNPTSGKVIHVDFFRVNMSERISIKLPIHFVGESAAVKDEGGVLLHLLETLDVECTASDIIDFIEVDISSLREIDATLHASDVKLPASFTLITDPTESIAKVAPTRAEKTEETAAAAETPAPAAAPAPEA